MKFYGFAAAVACLVATSAGAQQLAPSPTLDAVKARGNIECGVHLGLPGFSFANDKGEWTGLDVDYCRSLAAAVLGDATKVKFTPTSVQQRWPMLQSGQVDLLARNTTITFSRNATLGVNFQGINFYEGQTFVVRTKAKVNKVADLADATICVAAGSTEEKTAADWFRERNLKITIINFQKNDDAISAYDQGRCDAYTAGIGALAGQRIKFKDPGRAPDPDRDHLQRSAGAGDALGRRALAADRALGAERPDRRRGVRHHLQERRRDEGQVDQRRGSPHAGRRGQVRRHDGPLATTGPTTSSSRSGTTARATSAPSAWARPLKLKRGANELWTKGGLLFTPPFQ